MSQVRTQKRWICYIFLNGVEWKMSYCYNPLSYWASWSLILKLKNEVKSVENAIEMEVKTKKWQQFIFEIAGVEEHVEEEHVEEEEEECTKWMGMLFFVRPRHILQWISSQQYIILGCFKYLFVSNISEYCSETLKHFQYPYLWSGTMICMECTCNSLCILLFSNYPIWKNNILS